MATVDHSRQRRNCKGALTRATNALKTAMGSLEVNPDTVSELFVKVTSAFEAVESAHHSLVEGIEEDGDFQKEEEWMEAVQSTYTNVRLQKEKFMKEIQTGEDGIQTKNESKGPHETDKDLDADGNSEDKQVISDKEKSTSVLSNPQEPKGRVSDFNEIKLALELPKMEYAKFHGSPLEYYSFITNFEINIEAKLSSNPARLQHLKTMCASKARSYIECCDLLGDSGYQEAKHILKTQFGQPHMILNALMHELTDRQHLKPNDADALWDLIASMKKCYVTLTKLGYTTDLNSTTNLLRIQDLLPRYLQTSWVKKAHSVLTSEGREPIFNDLLDHLVKSAEVSSTMFGKNLAQPNRTTNKNVQGKHFSTRSNHVSSRPIKCFVCDGDHKVAECRDLLKGELDQRVKTVMSKRLCFRCLMPGHVISRCRKTWKCDCGSDRHHNVLHPPDEDVKVSSGLAASGSKVYMRILPVTVTADNGNVINTLALLDHGSDSSLCSENLRRKLGVRGAKVKYTSSTIHGDMDKEGWRFVLGVKGREEVEERDFEFLTVPKIPASEESIPTVHELQEWSHLRSLPWRDLHHEEVEILIGADSPGAFWVLEERKGRPKEPYGIKTPLGWSVMGPGGHGSGSNHVNRINVSNQQLLEEVQRSWAVENSGLYDSQESVEDARARRVMDSTMTKDHTSHYEMGLLWRNTEHKMPSNRPMAETRLDSLRKRLLSNSELHAAYTEAIEGYIEAGYAEPVPDKGEVGNTWYLPHHPVVNPHKKKIRVVYDCAARYAGTSLNDQLLKGPDLMNDLLGVLLRFRKGRVAIVSDIEAMFHQVKMLDQDRDVLRFLWWEKGDLNSKPKEYRMCVHLFGATSSPCCASKALKQTADDNELDNGDKVGKQALEIIRHNFYVDDCLSSVQDAATAIDVVQRLTAILSTGGFRLTKWLSNERAVLDSIDESERAPSVQLEPDGLPTEKTLGVCWNADNDSFTFRLDMKERPITRRGLLSVTSSVFDPLGIASPFVFIARSLLQQVCRRGADWDEPLTDGEASAWRKWLENAEALSQVKVPRWFKLKDDADVQLHIFCDASEKGYAAVAYFRVKQGTEDPSIEFVLGKARVSPVKSVTIPRLELMAAVLAATLDNTIRREIGVDLGDTTFWSDSMVVLSYLRSQSGRFKTFVANRVAKILSICRYQQWRHVPTGENPADEGSRGTYELGKWVTGPDFLAKEKSLWPTPKFEEGLRDEDPEIKRLVTVQQVGVQRMSTNDDDLLSTLRGKFSSWNKLRRVLAWVLRFPKSLRAKVRKEPLFKGNLTVSELDESETLLLSWEQKRLFPDWQSDRHLQSLSPVLLGKLLRVGGRLDYASIDHDAKHPIILAGKEEIIRLLVWHYHQKVGHSGWAATLNAIRERFWITKGRSVVKAILRDCVICKRQNARRIEQLMAPLPVERVTPDRAPFAVTGLDYFGPLDVKQGRSTIKMYGCIFTCLTSRAVHIELADSLDADSFINAYRRFVARRGNPVKIFSDNGTNFVGSEKELKNALNEMNQDRIEEFLHTRGTEWQFNPPSASHFGGVWERLIRSVKRILYSVLKQQRVNRDVLQTVLVEAENIMNSRPLTDLSPEAYDKEPLTPNHLLLMREGAPAPTSKLEPYSKRRWLQAQYLASLFWARWKKEYLPLLQKRQKWTVPRKNVQVGDIVLLTDELVPRGKWPMGKVLSVRRSKDGKVRSVELRVASNTIKRPVAKLCVVHRESACSDSG